MRLISGLIAGLWAFGLVGSCMAVLPADAEGLRFSTPNTSRTKTFRTQAQFLDTRLARQYENSARLLPGSVRIDAMIPAYRGGYNGPHLEAARKAARRRAVPEDLFLRLVQQESGWNAHAVSPKGARGLAQLMPATAQRLGVDPSDPVENLEGGARYLRQMYDRFGSWRLALAAYNAGPEAVEANGGVPPYAETKAYVRAILGS